MRVDEYLKKFVLVVVWVRLVAPSNLYTFVLCLLEILKLFKLPFFFCLFLEFMNHKGAFVFSFLCLFEIFFVSFIVVVLLSNVGEFILHGWFSCWRWLWTLRS